MLRSGSGVSGRKREWSGLVRIAKDGSEAWWKCHMTLCNENSIFYLMKKAHTECHPFLCLKKGERKFIPNSFILNLYLYSQKSHFHELNGWETGPLGPTVFTYHTYCPKSKICSKLSRRPYLALLIHYLFILFLA